MMLPFYFFFFNDTATTEIYTLSLHDALPISAAPFPAACGATGSQGLPDRFGDFQVRGEEQPDRQRGGERRVLRAPHRPQDRKSTRLNSSHSQISYAVFCLKKNKRSTYHEPRQ